jgi:uncharacterized membrane protein
MRMTTLRTRSIAAVLLGLLPLATAAQDNSDIAVSAVKDGETIRVEVDAPVRAPREVAWEVLTDYDNMAKFISNLQQSVTRMKMGNRLQVYQKGKASRGPLSMSFENLREIELVPQTEVRSRMISGDIMPASFTTRIEERDGQVHIKHSGQYTPSIWVPPVIGTGLIEAETRKQYGEIRDEILRRAKAR